MNVMSSFIDYLKTENELSKTTVDNYVVQVGQYLNWLEGTTGSEFKKLHRLNVKSYIQYLEDEGKERSTINTYIAALVRFNKFLIDKGIQTEEAILLKDKFKIQKSMENPNRLELQDVERFRQQVLDEENYRNYAIITLMAYAGLRLSEVLNLKVSDVGVLVSEHAREIRVTGKGNKQRVVPMSSKVYEALKQYYTKQRQGLKFDTKYLFVSSRGNNISRSVINEYFRSRGVEFSPHDLRHFFCSCALENGLSVEEVASLAGHSSYDTTKLYIHHSRRQLWNKLNLM